MVLVLNSTPLIYLAKINVLKLLEELPEKKVIPPSVHEEVVAKGKAKGATDAISIEKAIDKRIIRRGTIKDKKFLRALLEIPGLHKADAEVLTLAKELKATAVMDDDKARAVADLNDIANRGTAYLLLRLQKLGLLKEGEVKRKVDEMIKLGWRCSTEVYAEILEEL